MKNTLFLKKLQLIKDPLILFLTPALLYLIIYIWGNKAKDPNIPKDKNDKSHLKAECLYVILVSLVYYTTNVLPMAIVSFIPVMAYPYYGIMTVDQVCQNYMKSSCVFFLFSMIFSLAIQKWHIGARIAFKLILLVGTNPFGILIGLIYSTGILSFFMNNLATASIMLLIAKALVEHLDVAHREQIIKRYRDDWTRKMEADGYTIVRESYENNPQRNYRYSDISGHFANSKLEGIKTFKINNDKRLSNFEKIIKLRKSINHNHNNNNKINNNKINNNYESVAKTISSSKNNFIHYFKKVKNSSILLLLNFYSNFNGKQSYNLNVDAYNSNSNFKNYSKNKNLFNGSFSNHSNSYYVWDKDFIFNSLINIFFGKVDAKVNLKNDNYYYLIHTKNKKEIWSYEVINCISDINSQLTTTEMNYNTNANEDNTRIINPFNSPIKKPKIKMLPAEVEMYKRLRSFKIAVFLGICYSASIGGTGTIIGANPNMIFKADHDKLTATTYDYNFTFVSFSAVMIPIVLVQLFFLWLILIILYVRGSNKSTLFKKEIIQTIIQDEYDKLGNMKLAEFLILILFIAMVVLLIVQGVTQYMSELNIIIIIVCLLFIIPAEIPKWMRSYRNKENKINGMPVKQQLLILDSPQVPNQLGRTSIQNNLPSLKNSLNLIQTSNLPLNSLRWTTQSPTDTLMSNDKDQINLKTGLSNDTDAKKIHLPEIQENVGYKIFESNNDNSSQETIMLLDWETVTQEIPWGVIFLLGGSFALAHGCEETQLLIFLENMSSLSQYPYYLIDIILLVIAVILTQFLASTTIATMLLSTSIKLAMNACVNPTLLMLSVTVGVSYSFILPISTSSNALAYSYGLVQLKHMILTGFVMCIMSTVIAIIGLNSMGILYSFNQFPYWAGFNCTNGSIVYSVTSLMPAALSGQNFTTPSK